MTFGVILSNNNVIFLFHQEIPNLNLINLINKKSQIGDERSKFIQITSKSKSIQINKNYLF